VNEGLNIGAISRLTGIPADTLRTWERRYGFPAALRTASGHRRYASETCERLLVVRQLLVHGYKPSTILGWDLATLQAELHRVEHENPQPRSSARLAEDALAQAPTSELDVLDRWIAHARRFDSASLERELTLAWDNVGAMQTLEQLCGPFLRRIGQEWAAGNLDVRHEHFVSERLEGFLARRWVPLSDRAVHPLIVCATPVGEYHVLGLHLAAMVMTLAGAKLCFLGPSLPAPSIAAASSDQRANGIALSVTAAYSAHQLNLELETLRSICPTTPILVGGAGALNAGEGFTTADNLARASAWITELAAM
jgi:DNA-binding transcriptional MerR regulator